ncbi:MAG: PQQ-dependent sugar dehydrogenase, partial [Microcystis panniformis WG22]|nr:PQQ-dependent sugar dehydrogenase [Microcystis panniformis WG22]
MNLISRRKLTNICLGSYQLMLTSLNRIFSPIVSGVLLTIIISSCQGANVLTS